MNAHAGAIETPQRDGVEEGRRLVRADDRGLSLVERVGDRLRQLAWRSPLHNLALRGRFPLKLIAVPVDPLLGPPGQGQALLQGRLEWRGGEVALAQFDFRAAPSRELLRHALSFEWLRSLASATADRYAASAVAEPMMRRFLAAHSEFSELAWAPDLIGLRILQWTAHAPLILSSPDHVYRSAVLNSLARQARHLDRAAAKAPEGLARVTAFAGMAAAGLLIPGGEPRLARAEHGMARALATYLLPDGGVASRAPADALALLEVLTFAAAGWMVRRLSLPPFLGDAIARLTGALRGVTLGDGALSAWHGGGTSFSERVERATEAARAPVRPLKTAPDWGFQRLSGNRTVLVADCGPPPPARVSSVGHASSLAFEFSDGPERVVVNCGGEGGTARPVPADLAPLLRSTAAHSTLVIGDVNSTQVRADGTLGRGVNEVISHRRENEGGAWLDLEHDGYVRRFGLRHARRLFLGSDGTDLRGEDTLLPGGRARKGGKPLRFDVRFHLAPGVDAVPTADGQGALIRLPSGKVWRFRCRGGTLSTDESLHIAGDGTIKPTTQLVVSGEAAPGGASLAWTFQKS